MPSLLLLDPEAFDLKANSVVAAGDDGPLLAAVDELDSVLTQLQEDDELADVAVPITNAAAIAALGLRHGHLGLFAAASGSLQAAYGWLLTVQRQRPKRRRAPGQRVAAALPRAMR